MPEPASVRGNAVTASAFEAPFETPIVPFGMGGLNLADAVDAVAPNDATRLTNVYYTPSQSRELTGRLGQTAVATGAGTNVHSIARLTDVLANDTTRLWGGSAKLYRGLTGAVTEIDDGYSGLPLTILPHHTAINGVSWAFIGDSLKMQKVRFDGLNLPIGLPAPAAAAAPVLATQQTTYIAAFDQLIQPDGTQAENWTGTPGFDYSDPPLPTGTVSGFGGQFTVAPAADVAEAGNGFWAMWGIAKTVDLNTVGSVEANDQDVIHLTIKLSQPWATAEVRLYLVCSPVFSPSILPGAGVDADGNPTDANTDFYVKSFRPDDFSSVIAAYQDQITAAEQARVAGVRQDALAQQSNRRGFGRVRRQEVQRVNTDFMAQRDPVRDQSLLIGGAAEQFIEFGLVGIPFRRGDFKRYGSTLGCDWSTITGLVLYVQTLPRTATPVAVTLVDWFLTGGAGPDTSDPGAQSYDYRYTHYDPRSGAEGNPSPEMSEDQFIDALRRGITIPPVAYGDAAVRQRFYRRGGTLLDDWYFVGENDADGGSLTDENADAAIEAAGTVAIDHYEAIPTVDADGNTVLGQPVPILFGPYNGMLFALGDPYRPGYVYGCIPGEPDHWPPDLVCEVCSPTEELMTGGMFGGQPFAFSRERMYQLYTNPQGVGDAATITITAQPTEWKKGPVGRWALTVGAGAIFVVADDGVYRVGQLEPLSGPIKPLFQNLTVHGYRPIDFAVPQAIRLAVFEQELWFGFQDTHGDRQVYVLQLLTGRWRHYGFGQAVSAIVPDEDTAAPVLLLGGVSSGAGYTHSGTSDAGTAIAVTVRTGSLDFGRPREEKLFGDQFLDLIGQDTAITLQNFLNRETVTNPAQVQTVAGTTAVRAIYDSFGTEPQRARTIATEIAWSTTGTPPTLYVMGTAITPQPDLTINRVTNWDDLGRPDESYVMGVTFDCDTGGVDRTITIEGDFNGTIFTIAVLTVNCATRHKRKFSWTAVQANQVRIRPDDECAAWILYRADWIAQAEPPRIARWDVHFENSWDQYYTGLDLYCDTNGATKRVVVTVDGVPLTDPATGLAYWEVIAVGRQVVHLTLPWGRGHVFHFYATDENPGLLYQHRWHLVEEPTEQTNWVQPFTILGTQADKYLKAVVLEVDTFGQDKTVQVQADETTLLTTFTVNTSGRQVVQVAFPQVLGRVFRFFPTDANPSRLYSLRPVFDEEPFALTRWETQELDFDEGGFFCLLEAQVTLKSSTDVTLTLTTHLNQTGTTVVDPYTIPSTGGVKQKRFVPFVARKGVLAKFVITGDAACWLYQEESHVLLEPWDGGAPREVHPFGNADADRTRGMINTTLAAARSGGGS